MRIASLILIAGGLLAMAAVQAQSAATKACPPYTNGKSLDTAPLFERIDADHDGKLTHEEWVQAGAPEASWQRLLQFPKVQQQGYVTRADFQSDSLPHGVDGNCNGVLTLQELADYERMAAAAESAPKPGRKPVLPVEPRGVSSSAGSGGIPGAGATGAAGAGAPGVPGTAPPVQ